MIAERNKRSIPYYSTGTLNELELDGYCDFGFPIGAHEYYCSSYPDDDHLLSPTTLTSSSSSASSSFSPPRSRHFAATLPRVTSSKLELRSSRLDEVVRSFARAFATDRCPGGREIDAAMLLRACRAHLELMRVGGSALCLVAKDLENNLRKAESVFARYSSTLSSSSSNNDNNNNNSNSDNDNEFITLTSLLKYERNTPGVHNGNILGENSAAMGLLWIRRSLAFQSHLFESLIPTPRDYCSCRSSSQEDYHRGEEKDDDEDDIDGRNNNGGGGGAIIMILTPRTAADEAYQLHLAPYHGWILRRVFPASLSQMPHRAAFLSKFGEVEVNELDDVEVEYKIVRKLQALVSTLEPLLMLWKDSFERLNLEDTRRV